MLSFFKQIWFGFKCFQTWSFVNIGKNIKILKQFENEINHRQKFKQPNSIFKQGPVVKVDLHHLVNGGIFENIFIYPE